MSGSARVLVEDLPQRRGDPRGDLGPFGVPRDRQSGSPNATRRVWEGPTQTRVGDPGPILIGCFPMPIGKSAFPGKTSPIRVNAGLRTKACETKPICRHGQRWARAGEDARGASLGLIASNEPNLPRPSRKRPWLPGPQALPTLGASAPNEANLGRPEALLSLGTSVQNEANFPPAGGKGPEPAGSSVPAPPGRNVRNKANSTRATRTASTWRKKSYGTFGGQTASAKQSQLPDERPEARAGKAAGAAAGTRRAKRTQFAQTRKKTWFPATRRWKKSGEDAHPTKQRRTASLRTRRMAGDIGAKQTQFTPHRPERTPAGKGLGQTRRPRQKSRRRRICDKY